MARLADPNPMKQSHGPLNALARGIAAISPGCKEAVRLQAEALNHPLPLLKRIGLRTHLLICKWCRRYETQVQFMHQAAHDHPETLTELRPETLSEEARNRIRQRLHPKSE
jgi:hypothetical protein